STRGDAFSTRTAGFIIQEHFPPGVDFRAGGPLYGVQFSSLPGSDIKQPGLPLGLSADPGGLPLYKNGQAVGGIGIEGDGLYTVDRDPTDLDQPFEEAIAVAAERGFEPPSLIRGDNILVDGIRLAYQNVTSAPGPPTIAFGSLPGTGLPAFPIRGAQISAFTSAIVGGISGEIDTRFFPFIAAALLRAAGLGSYVDRANADGLRLDGSVAFTDRAGGFLHRPFFPDGINNTVAGPFSTELNEWSPFNVGLQLDLIEANLLATLAGTPKACSSIPNLPNGIQIFPGSVPLYKNGVLVGGIGISGDGVDQDDLITAAGGNGFSPAPAVRSDQVFVRGVRLPFLKFPRSPNL